MRRTAVLLSPLLLVAAQSLPAQIDREAVQLLRPVLEALCACQSGNYDEAKIWTLGERLWELHSNGSKSVDEAEVVMLDYALDGANAEDLVEGLADRGARIVPLLRKYRARPTWGIITSKTCPDPPRKDPFARETDFLSLMDRLDKPKVDIKWQPVPEVVLRVTVSNSGQGGRNQGQRLDVLTAEGALLFFKDGRSLLGLLPLVVGPTDEQMLLAEWETEPDRSAVWVLYYVPGTFRLHEGRIVHLAEWTSTGSRVSLNDVDGDGYPEVLTFERIEAKKHADKCRSLVAVAHKWNGNRFETIKRLCAEGVAPGSKPWSWRQE
jgi:hypothetical protein